MKKIIVCLLTVLLLCSCSAKSESVVVEEFVDRNVSEVYEWCGKLPDSMSCEVIYEDKDGYERDIVFEQSVTAGKKLNGDIQFKVASGKEGSVSIPYIEDMTMSDIEVWKEAIGMKNVTYVYETSDTIAKNRVIRIEPMTNLTLETPLTVYISSGPKEPEVTSIKINYGDYIGITVADFEAKAKALGLNPNHQESRDRYDANVKFGNIVWHGSGTYEKGETFNYGVCINSIAVNPNEYVGLSVSDFEAKAKSLSLKPKHIDDRDVYSTSIEKGKIATHGYGYYVEGEDFKYGVSKGPAKVESGYEGASEEAFLNYLALLQLKGDRKEHSDEKIAAGRVASYNYGKYSAGDYVVYYVSTGPVAQMVDVPSFEGKSEQSLLDFLSSNGLYAGTRSEVTSSYSKGTIISNTSGKIAKGSRIDYRVAADNTETSILESFDTIYNDVVCVGDYERTEHNMQRYLFGRCFMNYHIYPVAIGKYEPGILLYIEVDGVQHDYAESVPIDAQIDVYISANPVE